MLDDEIRKMLDKEYSDTLKAIKDAQAGSEEAKWQLQKLTELHKQRMNEEQTDRDTVMKHEELVLKKQQLTEGKKDRIVKIVLEGAVILVPCVTSSYWMGKGLKFEETGSFTSRVGNWVSSNMRLFKK